MTTETNKTENKGNGFPVELTKNYIKERILSDLSYAMESLVAVYEGQTKTEKTYEKSGVPSKDRNGTGFMSSHAVRGSILAVKIKDGEDLTKEEQAEVQQLASHYTRQLARRAREQAPASVKKALAVFFSKEPKAKAPKAAKTAKAPKASKTAKAPRSRKSKANTEAA